MYTARILIIEYVEQASAEVQHHSCLPQYMTTVLTLAKGKVTSELQHIRCRQPCAS